MQFGQIKEDGILEKETERENLWIVISRTVIHPRTCSHVSLHPKVHTLRQLLVR